MIAIEPPHRPRAEDRRDSGADRRAGAREGGRRRADRPPPPRPRYPVAFAVQLIAQLEPAEDLIVACPYPRRTGAGVGVIKDTKG